MSGGFEAVPELMRQAVSRITDMTGEVEKLVWQGPSGDYGDARLQSAWRDFVEAGRDRVHALREQADEYGNKLGDAAAAYREVDESTAAQAKRLEGMLTGLAGAGGDGGVLGGLGGVAGAGSRAGGGPVGATESRSVATDLGKHIHDVLDLPETGGSPGPHEGPVF